MEWEELVLSPVIHDEIENINAWMAHKNEITDNIVKQLPTLIEKKIDLFSSKVNQDLNGI